MSFADFCCSLSQSQPRRVQQHWNEWAVVRGVSKLSNKRCVAPSPPACNPTAIPQQDWGFLRVRVKLIGQGKSEKVKKKLITFFSIDVVEGARASGEVTRVSRSDLL